MDYNLIFRDRFTIFNSHEGGFWYPKCRGMPLVKSCIVATPSMIHLVVQISSPHVSRHFDYFLEDDEEVLEVGSKRSHLHNLQDHIIIEDEAFKKDIHDSLETAFVDRQMHDSIIVGALSNIALPPPPPPPSFIHSSEDAPDWST